MAGSSLHNGDGGDNGASGGYEDEKAVKGKLLPGEKRDVSDVAHSTSETTRGNGKIGEPAPEENKNHGDGKNQLLEDINQIKHDLRKNNEEIQMLRKTVLMSSWDRLRDVVKKHGAFPAPSMQETVLQLIESYKNHQPDFEPLHQPLLAQNSETPVTGKPNGTKQSSKSPQTTDSSMDGNPETPSPPNRKRKKVSPLTDKVKPKGHHPSVFGPSRPKRLCSNGCNGGS